MKTGWVAVAIAAAAALVAADPALARKRHKPLPPAPPPQCVDQALPFSWLGILTNQRPQPNGCSPAVHNYGYYIGQDPDPNIRFQLMRDPSTGYGSTLQP